MDPSNTIAQKFLVNEAVETDAPAQPLKTFDREKAVLYSAALLTVLLVITCYVLGYLWPAIEHTRAIVGAFRADKAYKTGCFLLSMEHANRMQSAYALRFLGMLIGTTITFVGMVFSIKGLEAGYSLDVKAQSTSASLKTASPGLVLCTLGIILCAAAMLNNSELSFQMAGVCLR
jgi:uncharacterized membrane protein YidH (DUF202 family)